MHKLPVPKIPVTVTENDIKDIYSRTERTQEKSEKGLRHRMLILFCNGAVICLNSAVKMPKATELPQKFLKSLQRQKIIPIYARDIIVGGGNIHCITQQIPFADKGGKI